MLRGLVFGQNLSKSVKKIGIFELFSLKFCMRRKTFRLNKVVLVSLGALGK